MSATDWALVTGASSGLGRAFAELLAEKGINLVLVARSGALMEGLADELRQRYRIEAIVEPMDLAEPGSAKALEERLLSLGITVDILINNAAFGLSSPFVVQDLDRVRQMLQLDILTLTELTHIFARQMVARGRGNILLVASLAAYQPTPILAAYGAAKAYVLSLGESLNVECAPNVGVTVLSPGLMDTGFNAAAGYKANASMAITMLPTQKVARIGLKAMWEGKSSVVAGRLNWLMAFSSRFSSRHFQARAVFRLSTS